MDVARAAPGVWWPKGSLRGSVCGRRAQPGRNGAIESAFHVSRASELPAPPAPGGEGGGRVVFLYLARPRPRPAPADPRRIPRGRGTLPCKERVGGPASCSASQRSRGEGAFWRGPPRAGKGRGSNASEIPRVCRGAASCAACVFTWGGSVSRMLWLHRGSRVPACTAAGWGPRGGRGAPREHRTPRSVNTAPDQRAPPQPPQAPAAPCNSPQPTTALP